MSICLEHALHFLDVFLQVPRLVGLAHQGERKLEPREDGAQIVAHAIQDGGALLERPFDPPFHFDKSLARLPHLPRAARIKFKIAPLAERFRRARKQKDRLDLVAQKGDRRHDQDERSADHPPKEDLGIGRVGGAAQGDDAQDRVIELDPDLDEIRAPDRIEPEGLANLAPNLVRQGGIEDREERFWQRGRQFAVRQEFHVDFQPLLGDLG